MHTPRLSHKGLGLRYLIKPPIPRLPRAITGPLALYAEILLTGRMLPLNS